MKIIIYLLTKLVIYLHVQPKAMCSRSNASKSLILVPFDTLPGDILTSSPRCAPSHLKHSKPKTEPCVQTYGYINMYTVVREFIIE